MSYILTHVATLLKTDAAALLDEKRSPHTDSTTIVAHLAPHYILLSTELTLLTNQLHAFYTRQEQLLEDKTIQQVIKEKLITALLLSDLLSAITPFRNQRKQKDNQNQRQLYIKLLENNFGYFYNQQPLTPLTDASWLDLIINKYTIESNWYKILLNRVIRLLNAIKIFLQESADFYQFIAKVDQGTRLFLVHLTWVFPLPRFASKLFWLGKYTFGFGLSEEERKLGWWLRFKMQGQQCWFELGNDGILVVIGLINCLVLTGVLAPFASYLVFGGLVFDVFNAALRAYIELDRLYELKAACHQRHDQHLINERIRFERWRFINHVGGTVAIVIGAMIALPVFAVHPLMPLVGAVFLMLTWLVNFIVAKKLEAYRPPELTQEQQIDEKIRISSFSIFKANKQNNETPAPDSGLVSDYSCTP